MEANVRLEIINKCKFILDTMDAAYASYDENFMHTFKDALAFLDRFK